MHAVVLLFVVGVTIKGKIFLQTGLVESPSTHYVSIHKIIYIYYINKLHYLLKLSYE